TYDKEVEETKQSLHHCPYRKMNLIEHMTYIERIADMIDADVEEIAHLESLDTGLPIRQTRKMVSRAAENFRFYSRMVETRMHGDAYMVDEDFMHYAVYKRLGAVDLMTNWYAPSIISKWKVGPEVPTWNSVVVI